MIVRGLTVAVMLQAMMVSTAEKPKMKLHNGREMPCIALGTYLGHDKNGMIKPRKNEVRDVILRAIDLGYRHFDTASIYETEAQIGEAFRMKIQQGFLRRDDLFLTTKLWNTSHKPEDVVNAIKESLNKTGLEYIDMYLMHWPLAINEDYTFSDIDYLETWKGMEEVQRLGLAKAIGVCNFNLPQLERLVDNCTIKPSALQVEFHPQLGQGDFLAFCKKHGMVLMGYSPLGSLVNRYGIEFAGPKIDDPVLEAIGKKHGKTTPQVVLRWAIEKGVVPLPKTVQHKYLAENINIFDFKLTPKDIEQIDEFNSNTRYTLPSFWQDHKYYPFPKVDKPIANPFTVSKSK